MITGAGFTVMITLMACLPGYGQWGFVSIMALIVMRLINGIFLGGGYAGPCRWPSSARRSGCVGWSAASSSPAPAWRWSLSA